MADPIRVDPVSRRTVLKGIAGAAGLVSIPAIIAACSSSQLVGRPGVAASAATAAAGSAASARCTSAATTPTPARRARWRRSTPPSRPRPASPSKMNTVDHSTFQDQITNYLGGTPDTAYTWFSGFRHEVLRRPGLQHPDRRRVGQGQGQLHRGLRPESVVGNDGKVYGIPVDYYPWAVFYRKSVFADKRLHGPRRPGTTSSPCARRCRRTASPRSPSATRTAGRRWARSTS